MTQAREINLTSVSLVKDELAATLDAAASHLDQFAADRVNEQAIDQCLAMLRQAGGALQLVQLRGGELLAQEMLAALLEVQQGRQEVVAELLDSLGTSFYVLSRYLEVVQSRAVARPELLIPYINNLRLARGHSPVSESHFFHCRLDANVPGVASSAVMPEELNSFLRRFRHMYQLGLLALLQGKPLKPAFTMMARALQRVASVSAGRPNGKLWALAGEALGAMAVREMRPNRSRIMVFSMLDRSLRALQKQGDSALDQPSPPVLVRECLYWVALAGPGGQGDQILEAFAVQPLGYNDEELERERASLGGPGATAINAVAKALEEELAGVRRMLDDAESLSVVDDLGGDSGLIGSLQRIAGTMQLLNFKRLSDGLRAALMEFRQGGDGGGQIPPAVLQRLTGQVLQVDSAVRVLRQSASIDLDEYGHADISLQGSQLAEAEQAVLREAEAGLSMIKRALASYAESEFDHGHIRNVPTTLNTLRGGLLALGLSRAAAVVERLMAFVETVMERRDVAPELEQSLDVFADAIISLEYYLGELKLNRQADVQSLNLAVESLAVLGYPVEVA
ncbi:hypothetical protein [Microbulbifer discodermiae]|uniref:hypothetical protein n=1 Tax=Microbulbifer sp. 2201CG32-9 TaxID=3232309 RepID=UPI00345B875C